MNYSIEEIRKIVYEVLQEIIEEYEMPAIELTDEILLVNTLGLNSIDITHMLTSIDMRFSKHLPYDNLLLKDGTFLPDFSLKQIIEFIHSYVNSSEFSS